MLKKGDAAFWIPDSDSGEGITVAIVAITYERFTATVIAQDKMGGILQFEAAICDLRELSSDP